MRDEAEEFQLLVRRRSIFGSAPAQAAPLVVVGGGTAGVGTTTVAVNLAVALARQGRRAVFVDADLERGGGLFRPHAAGSSIVDVLSGHRTVHEVLERGPSGIQVLAGSRAPRESSAFPAAVLDRWIAELKRLAPHAEAVVVDAGNGRGPLARRLWHAASAVVAVTTPADAARLQCYASIKMLASTAPARAPLYTFVNRADGADVAADVDSRLAEACRRFLGLRTSPAGYAAECERDEQAVLSPDSDAARALERAADAVWSELQLAVAPAAGSARPAAPIGNC